MRWVALVMAAATLRGQTAEKIIEEYLRAKGGAQALAQIRDATITGSLTEESSGKTGSFSIITKASNNYYLELIAGGERTVEAYNGMSGWSQGAEGLKTLTGDAAKEAAVSGRFWNSRLAELKKSKIGAVSVGMEKVRGRDVHHVKLMLGSGMARDVYFDARTHLMLREAGPWGDFEFDDYRPVQGLQTPHRVDIQRGGREYKVTVTRAAFNTAVDSSVFDFPRVAAAVVPEIKALILEVTKNQKAIEEVMKEYTCRLTTEQENVDSKGSLTFRTAREYEVFYVAGKEVRRLVTKDGKPLGADEKKKEDERFGKEFTKLQKVAAELAADPKKQKKESEKEGAQISDFLRAMSFNNARRERFRGQDVIAVDFGANPEYKPKKSIEALLQKLAGVLWIDEKAHDVARLEAHLADAAKIGAGILASVDKGSSFVFEQARINDEVWLPSYAEVHATGRFLVMKIKENEIHRYADYKKFRAESKLTVTDK